MITLPVFNVRISPTLFIIAEVSWDNLLQPMILFNLPTPSISDKIKAIHLKENLWYLIGVLFLLIR